MVRVCVFAAACLAAMLGVCVRAAWSDPVRPAHRDARWLLFGGTDLWRNGGFVHAGLMWAAAGLDREGPVLKLAGSGGIYRYRPGGLGDAEVVGRQLAASVMAGRRFRRNDWFITVLAGLDLQEHRLQPDDPGAGLRGSQAGLRGTIEIWKAPSETTMFSADASASTVGPSCWARLAYGWRAFDLFYVGPEIAGFSSGGDYQQARAGLHVTAFRFDKLRAASPARLRLEWSAAVGAATDSDGRSGLYVRSGMLLRE